MMKPHSGAAGSIAMGLGGYLAAKSDAEHYQAGRKREETEVKGKPEAEVAEVAEVFRSHGVTEDESRPIVDALRKRPDAWVDFMGAHGVSCYHAARPQYVWICERALHGSTPGT